MPGQRRPPRSYGTKTDPMRRGDVVAGVLPREYGKPRPVVVVQSNQLNAAHTSIVICPISSYLTGADLLRIQIEPSVENGLQCPSEIQADRVMAIPRARLAQHIGQLDGETMARLDAALRLVLAL